MLYNVQVNIKIEPVEGDSRRYRYLFSVGKEPASALIKEREIIKRPAETDNIQRSISNNAEDLSMNSMTFCKAFPWHFIMNEQLELVQMGRGFSKLYKPYMSEYGTQASTYFDFKRPKGLTMNFKDIVRRTYTPFLIALKNPSMAEDFAAKVNKY